MPEQIFRQNLKTVRLLRGMTQKELAKLLATDPNNVGNWETGVSFPSLDMLVKICDVLQVKSIDDFCRRKAKVQFCKAA